MANSNQAPKLHHSGEKMVSNQFYQIPQDIADIVFNELGNASAQLRVMLVLIGTKEGYGVSEQWILDRTGINHSSYMTVRKALINRGWITLKPSEAIIVNYDNIRSSITTIPQNNEEPIEESSITTIPHSSITTIPQSSITTIPITYNNTYNITDNLTAASAKAESTVPGEKVITLEQVEQLLEKGSYVIENNCVYCTDGRKFKLK